MFLDVIDPAALIAQPFDGHFTTQTFDQSLSCTVDNTWEFNLIDAFEDDVVRLHRIRRSERWPFYDLFVFSIHSSVHLLSFKEKRKQEFVCRLTFPSAIQR